MIFDNFRKELDELYTLTNNPEIYQKILELTQNAYFTGRQETLASWESSLK